ncbi:MAG: hypothetical protein ACPGOV_09875 [Magnetovibrionaceae bacterium]
MTWNNSIGDFSGGDDVWTLGLEEPEDAPVAEVVYQPVYKHHLGPRQIDHVRLYPGENPLRGARRALGKRFKVRDYVIVDARPLAGGLRDSAFWQQDNTDQEAA